MVHEGSLDVVYQLLLHISWREYCDRGGVQLDIAEVGVKSAKEHQRGPPHYWSGIIHHEDQLHGLRLSYRASVVSLDSAKVEHDRMKEVIMLRIRHDGVLQVGDDGTILEVRI